MGNSGIVSVRVTCCGQTPLLMNRMTQETLETIRLRAKRSKTASRPALPRDEAAPKVYLGATGRPYIPSENLLSCLISAGQFVRLDGKRQISNAKSTSLPAFMSIDDTALPLISRNGVGPPTWEVDMRPGRNPGGGEAVCIVRPRFDDWSFSVNITVDLDEIGMQTIREVFEVGGKRIGLGDFRPARKGMYGKFCIVGWEEKTCSSDLSA